MMIAAIGKMVRGYTGHRQPGVLLGLLPLLSSLACGTDEKLRTPGAGGTPSSVINEQTSHQEVAKDESFVSHEVTQFRTPDVLSNLEVRALTFVGEELWVGTPAGVAKLASNAKSFTDVPLDTPGPVVDFALLAGGKVAVAKSDRVVVVSGNQHEVWPVAGQSLAAVAAHGEDVIIGSDLGVSRLSLLGVTPIAELQGFAVRDLAVSDDVLLVATGMGVRRFDLATGKLLPSWSASKELPDDDVRALVIGSDGSSVVIGTTLGYSRITDGGTVEREIAGLGGLATGNVTALAERDGTLLLGHDVGLTAIAGGAKRHLHGLRWIGAEKVTAIALSSGGARFVGTDGGVARHAPKSWTLAEKAELFESMTGDYERMDGFMSNEVFRSDPWSPNAPVSRSDNDNDGLWTELQVAAWCFAYSVTKDQSHYSKARRAMDVMMLQIDVPGATFEGQGKQSGFITRSLVRSDEGALFESKKGKPNWHLQEYQGHSYYWKDDTSSDEYTGHFFGIPIFYDLCAQDEEERSKLGAQMDRVMGYLVDNGYRLLDLDGEPTTHGDWTGLANAVDGLGPCMAQGLPKCASAFGGEGWLGSVEILGFLLAAWHVTGNDRYYQEYLELAVNQRYGEMVTPRSTTLTLTSPKLANHSDHELAVLAYFTLLRYEPDAKRREGYLQAFREFYAHEKPERNALHLGLMASAFHDVEAGVAAQTLREIPVDRRLWLMDNGHRKDAKLSPHLDRFDDPQFETVFPYDELGELEWNSNLYAVSQGFDGRVQQSVWPFLLPYWSLRHFGALE